MFAKNALSVALVQPSMPILRAGHIIYVFGFKCMYVINDLFTIHMFDCGQNNVQGNYNQQLKLIKCSNGQIKLVATYL